MKCPKCGYNSFEIHDTCKKCANDLTAYKSIHGLRPMVLPQATRSEMAEKMIAEEAQEEPAAAAEVPVDMFADDLPDGGSLAGQPVPKGDPFNFHEGSASPAPISGDCSFSTEQKSAQARAEEEAFADLLETASPIKTPEATGSQGETGLESFSWDDSPDPLPTETTNPSEDFNKLFGNTDSPSKH